MSSTWTVLPTGLPSFCSGSDLAVEALHQCRLGSRSCLQLFGQQSRALSIAGGLVGKVGDIAHVAADLVSHCALLLGGRGNLSRHLDDALHGNTYAGQCLVCIYYPLDTDACLGFALLGGFYRLLSLLLEFFDQLVDISRSRGGALGQLAHLVGDHGKAATRVARTGRLNGRGEG